MLCTRFIVVLLAVLLATPQVTFGADFDRRYKVFQGIGWGGLAVMPVGATVLVTGIALEGGNANPGPSPHTVTGIGLTAAAPMFVSVGSYVASSVPASDPHLQLTFSRAPGLVALIMQFSAGGLATFGDPLFNMGDTALYSAAVLQFGSMVPATIQLVRNRKTYMAEEDAWEREMRELDEDLFSMSVAPVLGREQQGVAIFGRF
jgi:hypothetical protein